MKKEQKIKKMRIDLRNLKNEFLKKGIVDDDLLLFVKNIELKEKRLIQWRRVLKRNLAPEELYEISLAIDEELKKQVQQRYVETTSLDDLFETIKYDPGKLQELAWEELCKRIQRGKIKRRQAKKILIKVFKDVKPYRDKAIDVLQYMDPEDKELQTLLDLPFMDTPEYCELKTRIELLVRKKRKKPNNDRFLRKIKRLEEQIEG